MILGSDFEVFAVLTNNCMEARTCSFVFFAKTVSYNGKLGDSCGFASQKVEVAPGEGQQTNTDLCRSGLFDTRGFLSFQTSACPSEWSTNSTDQKSPLTG